MTIEHEPQQSRFVAHLAEGPAELAYRRPDPRVFELIHTFVPPAARGRGVGAALVEHAFRYLRDNGYRALPRCPFVRAWLQDHPGEQDLVESR